MRDDTNNGCVADYVRQGSWLEVMRFAIFSSSRGLPKKSKPLMCMKIQFVYMKIKFSSQRREMLLFLATNMAAVRHVQTSNCFIAVLVAVALVVA